MAKPFYYQNNTLDNIWRIPVGNESGKSLLQSWFWSSNLDVSDPDVLLVSRVSVGPLGVGLELECLGGLYFSFRDLVFLGLGFSSLEKASFFKDKCLLYHSLTLCHGLYIFQGCLN